MLPKINTPLNEDEINWLDDFLMTRFDQSTDPDSVDEGVICVSQLDGLMTAAVSGPVTVPPSQWLPLIWGDFEPVFENIEDYQYVMELFMRHMNNIAELLINQPDDFEPMFLYSNNKDEEYIIVDEWCEGYMRIVNLTAEHWQLGDMHMQILLSPIRAFCTEDGLRIIAECNRDEIHNLQQAIAPNVREIHAYWLTQRADLTVTTPITHSEPKVGRNEPCPCGSGKKYKKCCLH